MTALGDLISRQRELDAIGIQLHHVREEACAEALHLCGPQHQMHISEHGVDGAVLPHPEVVHACTDYLSRFSDHASAIQVDAGGIRLDGVSFPTCTGGRPARSLQDINRHRAQLRRRQVQLIDHLRAQRGWWLYAEVFEVHRDLQWVQLRRDTYAPSWTGRWTVQETQGEVFLDPAHRRHLSLDDHHLPGRAPAVENVTVHRDGTVRAYRPWQRSPR